LNSPTGDGYYKASLGKHTEDSYPISLDNISYSAYTFCMGEQTITDNISAVVSSQMMQDIERMAEQERRTVSFMTRILLEEALAARAKKAKKQ
jgi:hypothetical protein